MKKTASLIMLLLLSAVSFAQEAMQAQQTQQVEMAEGLFQSGKIYVVVSVLSIIFIGIVVYLIMLDRKIGKLEKEIKNK